MKMIDMRLLTQPFSFNKMGDTVRNTVRAQIFALVRARLYLPIVLPISGLIR